MTSKLILVEMKWIIRQWDGDRMIRLPDIYVTSVTDGSIGTPYNPNAADVRERNPASVAEVWAGPVSV